MSLKILSIIFLLISLLHFSKSATTKGEINCEYEIQNSGDYTKILGDKFLPDSTIIMSINDEEVTFSKKYLFPKMGIYYIKF